LHRADAVLDLSRVSCFERKGLRKTVSPQDLPFDVLAFLQERIAGTDELAALLLVRSDASRGWTAAAVAEQLELPKSWAGPALEGLCDAELLVEDGTDGEQRFWYRPVTPALESVVAVLSGIYEEQRTDVLRILNENAVDRIRAAAARTFVGAFEGKKHGKREGSTSHEGARAREPRDEGESSSEQ
jgi:hypothetical protein